MNTPHFCQSIRALGFRWGLPYLLSTPLDILLEVSRVYNEGLERNAVGGVFSQCPMSALCGFLTVMQGNSGLSTSYSALLAGFVRVVPTPLIRLVSDWVRRHIKQGMSWCRFPVGLCTLQVIHLGIPQPSITSWKLASSA